ncbi:MAG: ATP-binding protein, partial [Limibaculum sp.]
MERTFDRTLVIRHIAICAAAVAAYVLRSELGSTSPRPHGCMDRALEETSRSHPDVRWERSSDGTNPWVSLSDADLLEVLLVLLRNAAEAVEGRCKAWIEMRSAGGDFLVVVSDFGDGVSAETLSRVFEAGYTTKPQGSGYGLFLARRLLEKQGGRLAVKPSTGAGAVFEMALPLAAP